MTKKESNSSKSEPVVPPKQPTMPNDIITQPKGEHETWVCPKHPTMSNVIMTVKEYWNPFRYDNVEVESKFRAWTGTGPDEGKGAPHKHGLEIERDTGYIRITESEPILAVAVMGSGCAVPAYVVCEYQQPGESMETPWRAGPWRPEGPFERDGFNLQNLRRQMVQGMMSIHPSAFMRCFPQDQLTYTMDYEPRCFECSARFEIEPTTCVTIRGGSGTSSHFSVRMIRIYQACDPASLQEGGK